MPSFKYKGLDKAGKQVKGTIVAENAAAARKLLRNRQVHAHNVEPFVSTRYQGKSSVKSRNRKLVMEFTIQLATLVKAEIKLTEALDLVIAQTQNEKFKQALQGIRDQLLSGSSFAEGVRELPQYFDIVYASMIKVGEATGNLGETLDVLKRQMEKSRKLEQGFISAMIYPAILVIVCIVVITILMTVVVPKIAALLEASGKELPGMTKALIAVSSFVGNYWWAILLTVGSLYWLFCKWKATKSGRIRFDRFKIKFPVLGIFIRQAVTARFATTLAALMKSGMPMADALAIVADVTGNVIMTHAVNRARERIVGGADISTPLRESGVIDLATSHMITVGEKSGELEKMLENISSSMQEKNDVAAERIGAIIEPVIIVFMAVVVAFIFMAILIPMMDMSNIG